MRLEVLHDLGGVKAIVESYLEDTLAPLSPQDKEVLAEVFRYMVTPTGRKIAQTTTDLTKNLLSFAFMGERSLEEILSGLQAARLLRKVPPPRGSLPDETCYEFAHDVVAKAAFEWRRQFRRTRQLAEAEKKEREANQRAEEQARLAEMERQLSAKANLLAEEAQQRAQVERELAEKARALAEEQRHRAEGERLRAEEEARQARRFRLLAWALGGVLLLAVVAALLALLSARQAREAEQRARTALARSTVQDGERSLRDGKPNEALAYFARALRTDSSFEPARGWISDLLLRGRFSTVVIRHEGPVSSAAFSPDGKWVVTASGDQTARVWEAASGKEVGQPLRHEDVVTSAAFSPDGKWVVTASWDKTARVWEAASGKRGGAAPAP